MRIPEYPKTAKTAMKIWEREEDGPSFIRVLEEVPEKMPNYCENCMGNKKLLVSYTKYGPTEVPMAGNHVSLNFDGNDKWGSGWYKIINTRSYDCPVCEGKGVVF